MRESDSGLENCAKASFKKGKLASTGNIIIDERTAIEELSQEGVMIQIPAWVEMKVMVSSIAK